MLKNHRDESLNAFGKSRLDATFNVGKINLIDLSSEFRAKANILNFLKNIFFCVWIDTQFEAEGPRLNTYTHDLLISLTDKKNVAEFLQKNDIQIDVQNKREETALQIAVKKGKTMIYCFLKKQNESLHW